MIVHRTTESDVDEMIIGLYADWLMNQQEAKICNGGDLMRRMENCWGVKEFISQIPEQLTQEAKRVLGAPQ